MITFTRIRNAAITPLRGAAAAAVVILAILAGNMMALTATSGAPPVAVSALDLVAEAMAKKGPLPVDDSGTRGFLVFSPPAADGH